MTAVLCQQPVRFRCAIALATWAALLLVSPAPARAQESLDRLYQQAVDAYNNGKMEDACQALQQVAKQNPDYNQTQRYMKTACHESNRMYEMEEAWFKEGEQSYKQGRYDEAKELFEKASRIPLKQPKHRDQMARYLKEMESRQGEEARLQHCKDVYNQQKYDEAQACFTQVAQAGGPKASEARDYLGRVGEAAGKQRASKGSTRAFEEGVGLFKRGKYEQARAQFNQVVQSGGPKAGEARRYLGEIQTELAKAIAPPPKPEQNVKPAAGDDLLRGGLRSYLKGNYSEAEASLTNYLTNKGEKRELAYFFRGASHCARYLLSGEKDMEQKQLAFADFRTLKDAAGRFQPPDNYVSPKILAIYLQAARTEAQ